MKPPHENARPPRWAEAILRALLKPEDRESVSGDLLEEYRDTIVPRLGSAADRWYLRQVGSFLFRTSWLWGAIVGGALVIRYLFDTHVPVTNYKMRATILTYTIMGACLLAGFTTGWRTRSLRAGVLISFSAATIGALVSIAGAGVMLAIWHDPATLDEWRITGGLDEAFIDVPLKVMAIGIAIGAAGALLGKGVVKSFPASTLRTVLLAASIVSAACTSPTAPQLPPGAIQVNGTVSYFTLEGGFWAVRGDDGVTYDPMNGLASEFQRENLRVTLVAKIRNDLGGIHMVGPIVEVLSLRAR